MRITEKTKTITFLTIPILFSAFILFYNLGGRMLWADEAESALLSENITKFGVPRATDGKNYITVYGAGIDTNKDDVWVWRPWLGEYITAASFTLLGKTTTTARLPFALIAFLSVILLAFTTHRIYRKNEVTLFALLLFVTNVAFILHARQCRYYALIGLAQVILIYGFHQLLKGHSKSGIFYFALALILQFYSNYIVILPNLIGILITTIIVYRKHTKLIRNVILGLAIFSLFTVPWLLYAKPWHQAGSLGFDHFNGNLLYLLSQINFHVAPILVMLIPGIMYFTPQGKEILKSQGTSEKSINLLLWGLIPAYLFVLSLTTDLFFRYLIPLIPVLILLLSGIIADYLKPRLVKYLILAVLSFTNVISLLGAYPPRLNALNMPIIQFIGEVTTKYENKVDDVVDFLHKNARPEETIFVGDPEFALIFYTDMRVIDARMKMPDANKLPDWVFAQSASGTVDGPELQLPPALEKYYKVIVLPVHDSPRCDSCPEPVVHVSSSSKKLTGFKIYKKINQYN